MKPKVDALKVSCGITAMGALRGWGAMFDDRRPYKVCAAVVAGEKPDPEDIEYIDEMILNLSQSIQLLGASPNGTLAAAHDALVATKIATDDEPDEKEILRIAGRIQVCLRLAI